MIKEKILLLGNGVNRLSGNYSWENLLKDLIKKFDLRDVVELNEEKPFTLLYEEIALRRMRQQNYKELEVKKKVCELLKNIESNEFHEKIFKFGINHILTTNYDYNFEKAYKNGNVEKGNILRETKYSMFRRRTCGDKCGDKYIWHIHGEAEVPNSLILGHEHYAGYIQKMRNYLTIGIPIKNDKGKIKSPLIKPNFDLTIKNLEENKIYSWVDLFICCDVHIIGFSLDYTEIDLWWLIIYKEKLRLSNKNSAIGTTVFHRIKNQKEKNNEESKNDGEAKNNEEAKISLLKAYGVEIKNHEVNDNYEEAYKKIFDDFLNC